MKYITALRTAHSFNIMQHVIYAVLFTLLLSAFQVAHAAVTNGHNANVVEFGDNGGKLGTFRQISSNQWVEQNKQGNTTFKFRETHRDDWSVYLHDASRNVRLQLDLHRKIVGYSDPRSPMRDQYRIFSSDSKMNGWLVKNVTYKSGGSQAGAFVQKSGKTWQEIRLPSRTVAFTFKEQARDDWSVYLYDASRDVHIQLDLHTRKVMYNLGSEPRTTLYQIAKVK